jgi:hypothetical protein
MDVVCCLCLALHWLDECNNDSISRPTFGLCCHSGKVLLDRLPDPPLPLHNLFTQNSPWSNNFRLHIRQYNAALAFTSFSANEQLINTRGGRPWVFKTGYMLYHSSSSLLPPSGEQACYVQLYFYDPVLALDQRMNRNSNLHCNTMWILQDTLLHTNEYTQIFLTASEILQLNPSQEFAICFIADPTNDPHCYNPPTIDEIAAIIPGNDMDIVQPRDIILHCRAGGIRHISDLHSFYTPLHYILLFPYGTNGWMQTLQL